MELNIDLYSTEGVAVVGQMCIEYTMLIIFQWQWKQLLLWYHRIVNIYRRIWLFNLERFHGKHMKTKNQNILIIDWKTKTNTNTR